MLIETQYLGAVEVPQENIISFPDGIYGFEDTKSFALVPRGIRDDSPMFLQAVGDTSPSFVVFEPGEFVNDFNPRVPDSDLRELGVSSAQELVFFVIAVIPPDIRCATANYKSPVAINKETRVGRQVILENKNYPLRFPIFEDALPQPEASGGKDVQPCL